MNQEQGLLQPIGRTKSGYRLYTPEAEHRLRFIQRAQRLGFSLADVDLIVRKFKVNREKLGKGTKYRSPGMLVPCIIYAYYKENNKPINERELLGVARISKQDFNAFKLSIIRIWPEYQERNRKEYIKKRILELSQHFNLGMSFYFQSYRILNRFYESIKNTKDDVIVGLVTSITLLCSEKDKEVSVCAICERLNIKMSTIHRQVERKVMQKFKVSGFKSLVRSAELLKKVMLKLGVLDPAFVGVQDLVDDSTDIVQVVLGRAVQVHNHLTYSEENYLITRSDTGYLIASVREGKSQEYENYGYSTNKNFEKIRDKRPMKLELWKYYSPKGPPLTV